MAAPKTKTGIAAVTAIAIVLILIFSSVTFPVKDGTIFTVSQSEDGNLTYFTYTGDYMFDDYMLTGSTDLETLYGYLSDNVTCGARINGIDPVSCSAFCVGQADGSGYYTGRNFDFRYSNAGIVFSDPGNGYASVSTVDLRMFGDTDESFQKMWSDVRYNAVAYIPLDGLNEKGVFICINSVNGGNPIDQQDEGKVPMFTTSALRLVLDHADSTETAVELISKYNLNSESDYHLFICDASGDCRTVEYVDQKMYVTGTRLLTNHYLTEAGDVPAGESSLLRYGILAETLENHPSMTESEVRKTMRSVMQDNEDKVHYTRWSVVYDLENLSAGMCLRVGEEIDWNCVYCYSVMRDTGRSIENPGVVEPYSDP